MFPNYGFPGEMLRQRHMNPFHVSPHISPFHDLHLRRNLMGLPFARNVAGEKLRGPKEAYQDTQQNRPAIENKIRHLNEHQPYIQSHHFDEKNRDDLPEKKDIDAQILEQERSQEFLPETPTSPSRHESVDEFSSVEHEPSHDDVHLEDASTPHVRSEEDSKHARRKLKQELYRKAKEEARRLERERAQQELEKRAAMEKQHDDLIVSVDILREETPSIFHVDDEESAEEHIIELS